MANPYLAGADPALVNRNLEAMGATYRVPMPAPMSGGPMPDQDQLIAEQNAILEQQAAADLASAGLHGTTPNGFMVEPSAVMSDANAPMSEMPAVGYTAPGALVGQDAGPPAPTRQQVAQPSFQPPPVRGAGGGLSSPIPSMLRDAMASRANAERERTRAELDADYATEARKMNAEQLGESQWQTLSSVADRQKRIAADEAEYGRRLDLEHESFLSASKKVDSERGELTKFISEYEPKDRRSMGAKVAGAIAVGLGGLVDQNNLVAGLMQGMNVQTDNAGRAAAMISRSIDRDLEQQRMMLDNKRTALAAKTTELGQLRERYGDTRETLSLARAMKIEQAQQEIKALEAKGQSEQARILGQEASDLLEQQKQNELKSYWDKRLNEATAEEKQFRIADYNRRLAAANAARGPSAMDRLKLQEQALKNEKLAQELGQGGKNDPKIKEQLASFDAVIDSANKIKKTRADNPIERGLPGWLPGVTAPAQLEAQAADLDLLLKEGKKLGTLDKGSVEFLEQMRGNPASWSKDADVRLDEIIRSFENARARTLGVPTPDELAALTRKHEAR